MRVLVIEDEKQLAGHVSRVLFRYGHAVSAQHDGPSGLASALADPPDLIVLDLNLPRLDGLSLLANLRRSGSSARVLILTAQGEVEQRIRGLQAGADDYMAKPFSMDELVARIEALGRRATRRPDDVLKVEDLSLDVRSRRVARSGRAIALSPREFEVLQVLMQEPGRPFSRTELCERVWQRGHEYDTRTVEIFIARLRKKIDAGFSSPLIQTLRGMGYAVGAADRPLP